MANRHNIGKAYYEYRALFTLQKLFPSEYDSFLHNDKPDLYNDEQDMGIEVVRGTNAQSEKRMSFFQKHIDMRLLDEIPRDKMKWFEMNGCEVITGADLGVMGEERAVGYIPEARWFSTINLERAIKQKVEYIDRTNWRVNQLSLYVFSDSFKEYDLPDIIKLVKFTQDLQSYKNRKYKSLYIDDCGWFYRCDLQNSRIMFYDTEKILHEICVMAKEAAERNDA